MFFAVMSVLAVVCLYPCVCGIGLLQWGWGSAGGQDADHLAAHSVRAAHHPRANWLTFSQRSVLQWVSSWKPQIENGMILLSSTFCCFFFFCFIIKTFFSVLSDNLSRYVGSWSLKLLLLFFGVFFFNTAVYIVTSANICDRLLW